VNRCYSHAPNLTITWESENETCPLCACYSANEKLVRKVEKLKKRIQNIKKMLEKNGIMIDKYKKDRLPF
jgi:hypothetical protein